MSIARSGPECRLFIELHPCTCGEHQLQRESRVESTSAGLLAVYEGECPRCGVPRRFEFLLDPEIPPGDKFGGTRPSTLIDAGQFLAVADHAAKQVPHDPSSLTGDARRAARWWLARAVNALEEVLKFAPLTEKSSRQPPSSPIWAGTFIRGNRAGSDAHASRQFSSYIETSCESCSGVAGNRR